MGKLRFLGLAWICVVLFATASAAQNARDVVWVQIEAHPSLSKAQERARLFARELEDVNGFTMRGGWYGIALGPYRRSDAEEVLRSYRAQRLIPTDSYIAFSRDYRQQYWPVGANLLQRGTVAVAVDETPDSTDTTEPEALQVAVAPADETPAEARRSEQLLSRDERKDLQIALQWAGFYASAIDGAFGRGTRASMAAWQDANNHEVTGILTTKQRIELFAQYNAVLEGMDLRLVRDDKAGIEMMIPTGVVSFEDYDYPFARFAPKGDVPVQVLMISQEGDQTTLFGLYDIMQTLEIVPLDGERERRNSSFKLIGQNDKIVSHTEVALDSGQIKGFTLVWPAGDEDRRTRVLGEMRKSFERVDGVLDPSWSDRGEQAIDLVAGLQIRRPRLSRSGFFVSDAGDVVTTLEAVQNCTRITLDEDTEAALTAADDTIGVAVLTPQAGLAPRAVARFSAQPPRLQSDVAVSGFSYEGVLGAPTMTFGALSDLSGLRGEPELTRLELAMLEGDAGGPVFDQAGGVLGMLLPRMGKERQLPAEVSFAADGTSIQSFLVSLGIDARAQASQAPMAPEDITAAGRDITVLVSCWD